SYGKVLLRRAVYSEGVPGGSPQGHGWSSDKHIIPSFSYFQAVTGDMTRNGQWAVHQATAPHWALVLLFATLPVAWLVVSHRVRAAQSTSRSNLRSGVNG